MPADYPRPLLFPTPPGGRAPTDPPIDPRDLWAEGNFRFRIEYASGGPAWEERIDRPFGLIGRAFGSDVVIVDRAVSARHVYLHLDRRGLFAIDLATRTGTRFDGFDRPCGWIRPGESIEVAGRKLTLLDYQVRDLDGDDSTAAADDFIALVAPSIADADEIVLDARPTAEPKPIDQTLGLPATTSEDSESLDTRPNLLAVAGDPLARVTLYPARGSVAPRSLGSQLVVVGRGQSCGVRVEDPTVDRTHCLIVRGRAAAYLVDLAGRGTLLNGRPFQGAGRLVDGDSIALGETVFKVRVEPVTPATTRSGDPPQADPFAFEWPADMPPELQGTIIAWMMRMFQTQHGETARRQENFQNNLVAVIQQIHHDNAVMISQHLERMEAVNRELAALRDEIRQRLDGSSAPLGVDPAPALPKPPPLNIKLDIPPPTTDPTASTAWLLNRVQRLEEENRSTWRDLLARLSGNANKRPS